MKKIILLVFAFPFLVNAQTTLPTSWSFINPSPSGASTGSSSNPPVTYIDKTGWSTKLDVSTNGTTPFVYATGSDGSAACRLDGDGEYVQIWFAEKPGVLSYFIRGTAISPNPPFSGSFKIQSSVDGNTWTDAKEYTTMSGSFAKDSVLLPSTARYARFYYATKVSGSNVALDNIVLAKPAPGNAAAIEVKTNGNKLANGVTYINGTATNTDFTIHNLGLLNALTISSITISGENAADYSISNAPTSVAAGTSETFTLHFNPASLGSSKAAININSNDAENDPFVINLYGIGGNFATEPNTQPTDLSFANVKAYTFNVSFKKPAQKPEGYIVLRKNGSPVNETPVDGTTYKRGDYIGGNQVAYIGADTAFKPTYIVANTNYYFKVFAFNGPSGFENYLTTNALSGSVTSASGNPGSYYAGINSTNSNFVSALSAKVAPHDTVFYGNYTATAINNFYTRDTTNGKKVVNCVYTNIPYIYDEPFVWWGNTTGGTLTREHTFAQSWMPTRSTPTWPNGANGREFQEYNDLHHLFPADQVAGNNVRSNNPLGEVVTITSQNGLGKLGKDANGKTVYEPKDSHKGDAARAMFYMCIAYNGINGNNWSLGAISVAQQDEAILKKWHFQDLPDALEIARNEYVASVQNNRNPFIDSINFVCYINFSNMTTITNPGSCGATQSSLKITSPSGGETWTAGETHAITWMSANVDSVKIEYSIDGSPYTTINESVSAKDGSYSWVVPNTPSTNALIKITQINSTAPVSTTSTIFTIGKNTGVKEVDLLKFIEVYPNPSNGSFVVKNVTNKNGTCTLFDVTGRMIDNVNLAQAETTIKVENKGVYILQISTADGTIYKKVIIE